MANMLTPAEIAERWGCSPEHVARLCARGELRAMKLGGRGWRVMPSALETYEIAHTSEPAAPSKTPATTRDVTAPAGADFTLPDGYEPVFAELWGDEAPTRKTASQRH